jgi:hypothetical protein
MKKLKILNAQNTTINDEIDQKCIDGLDLIELNVYGNEKIINVSFMKNLKILNADYHCGINQNGRIRESRFSNSTCRSRTRYRRFRFN